MAAKQAGVGGTGNDLLGLGEIVSPRLRWDQILAEFMRESFTDNTESSFRKVNRRFLHMDIIMPTLVSEGIRELVVAPDASGSMYGEPATKVLGAVKLLAQQLNIQKVHLLYWDGEVGEPEEYDAESFQHFELETKYIGGGGTSPSCVPKYLEENNIKPECVVMLTDGYVDGWGEWDCPVIWAMTTDVIAPTGVSIKID